MATLKLQNAPFFLQELIAKAEKIDFALHLYGQKGETEFSLNPSAYPSAEELQGAECEMDCAVHWTSSADERVWRHMGVRLSEAMATESGGEQRILQVSFETEISPDSDDTHWTFRYEFTVRDDPGVLEMAAEMFAWEFHQLVLNRNYLPETDILQEALTSWGR